jgi:nucleotide-binding universal stress UspA family protein
MKIEEVVFPVDFSDRSVDVCPYVSAVTERLRANLVLLHVIESVPPGSNVLERLYTGEETEMEQRKEFATRALSAFQTNYIRHVPSQLCVLVGDAAKAIVAYAGETHKRMIVMPTSGYGPFRQMLLGSVTAKVLHDSKCPVLTGPHLERAIHAAERFSLRRLLCTVSLDWEADEVLKRAGEFASLLGAELIAVHVVTPVEEGLLPLIEPGGPPLSAESVRAAVQDTLDRTGVSGEVHICVGEVSRQVARLARAKNADLVVIGRGGAPELPGRLGSHGYAIVRRAPCPVLCV